jgi:hypothetical protein
MVGNSCNRTACRIRNRRRRHDNNMTLRKKKTPRASQHYMGWRAGQKSLLLPVAGEFFLLTLPFIERGYRRSEIGLASLVAKVRPARRLARLRLSVAARRNEVEQRRLEIVAKIAAGAAPHNASVQ